MRETGKDGRPAGERPARPGVPLGRPLRDRPLRDQAIRSPGPRSHPASAHLSRSDAPRLNARIAGIRGRALVIGFAVLAAFGALAAGGTLSSRPAAADGSPSPAAAATSGPLVNGAPPATPDPQDSSSCASVPVPTLRPLDPSLGARLDAALADARAKLDSPGLAAAILFPDDGTWAGATGKAADGVPLTTGMALPWASAGKPAIAATIVRLAEARKVGLADTVRSWLPLPAAKGATIADMLAHRAGLSDPFNDPAFTRRIETDPAARWTPDAVLDWVVPILDRGVFLYSNADYIAAGRIIEKATGEPWPTVVRRLVLRPAGAHAGAAALEPLCEPLAHAYEQTSSGWTDLTGSSGLSPYRSVLTAIDAAGGIAGTATDLALVGREIATSPDLAVMRTPRGSVTSEGPYGLGVSSLSVLGRDAVGHGGHIAGARSVWRCIVGGPCVAVLANRAEVDLEPTAETLLAIVLDR